MTEIKDLVLLYPVGHESHFEAGHPERPERVETIRQVLAEAGLWDVFPQLEPFQLPVSVLQAIHTPEYLNRLEVMCKRCGWFDSDTYTTLASWNLAQEAAGGGAAVAAYVWEGRARKGFALTRPPGHHATAHQAMGFCLLNNIALAAEYLLAEKGAHNLAIVDLDLHHGNGTQDIFYRRGEVLYLSTHQAPLYPGTGSLHETGSGPGVGSNVNLPLPPYSGDEAFRTAMRDCILPILNRYRPEMLLVSVGFDVHWRDPLGQLLLSTQVYGELLSWLSLWADQHCHGRLAVFLEGGYDLQAAGSCGLATVQALTGQPWDDQLGPAPYNETRSWEDVIALARRVWDV